MVSVMLLTVSLMTVALLMVRSSSRELQQAGALVQRERALMAAQATIDLGSARIRQEIATGGDDATQVLSVHLTGFNANATPICDDITKDCIPGEGAGTPNTGQRNRILTGNSDCAGRPCMRPGAVAELRNQGDAVVPWVEVRLADLIAGGDPDAVVTLWIRNNTSDALAASDGVTAHWTEDRDARVMMTAMATVNNTTVAIEQEMTFAPGVGLPVNNMATPDEGYGAGHNNDNASVQVCAENYVGYQEDP
jgi:hypothetical protein